MISAPPDGLRRSAHPMSSVAVGVFFGVLVASLWPSIGHGHPFGTKFYSYQITAIVETDSLGVTLVSEIPTTKIMTEFFLGLEGAEADKAADTRFTAAKLAEIEEGLQIVVDGTEVAPDNITPADIENGVGNSTYFTYTLNLSHPWSLGPGDHHTVQVINRNKTGGAAYYRNSVSVGEGVHLKDSTHWVAANDPAVQASKGWSRDLLQRDLVFTVVGIEADVADVAEGQGGQESVSEGPAKDWIAVSLSAFMLLALVVSVVLASRRGSD